jgi:enamine deaminase RidA (YjgF/YER057c/UK114 family)
LEAQEEGIMHFLKSLPLVALGAALAVGLSVVGSSKAATDHKYINLPGRSDNNPYSNAVLVGETLYLAGSIGLVPETGQPPESIEEEVRIIMDGMKRRLEMVAMTMDDVVSVQVFCPDLSLYQQFNDVYRTYFKEGQYPARAFVGSGPLLAGGHFEVMATAVKR